MSRPKSTPHCVPLTAALLALVAVIARSAGPAAADGCPRVVATGRAANPANYDPPRSCDPAHLAKERAIASWQGSVAASCPTGSTAWDRAREKKVNCEGYAGGIGCEVSAVPGGHGAS